MVLWLVLFLLVPREGGVSLSPALHSHSLGLGQALFERRELWSEHERAPGTSDPWHRRNNFTVLQGKMAINVPPQQLVMLSMLP